jgi:hypothetical protein
VPLRLLYTLHDPSRDRQVQVRFRDVLWLDRADGSLRIAKESLALYRAWAAYQVPDDVLEPPDPLRAQHAREAAARKRAEEDGEYRRSFVAVARRPTECSAHSTFADDAGDVLTYGVGSPPTQAADQHAHADLDVIAVRASVTRTRTCASFRFAGRLRPPLRVTISYGDTASVFKCCTTFQLLWLAPRRARFGYPSFGDSGSNRPRLIPADGARVSIGSRLISFTAPLPVPMPYAPMDIGWYATVGRGEAPAFGDWIPHFVSTNKAFVRLRDGRVVTPKRY